MTANAIWLLILSVSTSIAGVIGFAIQLRHVKKARLENEKLQLEIAALTARAEEAERRIVIPTNQEVQRITEGDIRFSIRRQARHDGAYAFEREGKLKEHLMLSLVVLGTVIFIAYFLYDLYRLGILLLSILQKSR